MILPEDAQLVCHFTDYLGMSDVVLDCEITLTVLTASMTGMKLLRFLVMYDIDTTLSFQVLPLSLAQMHLSRLMLPLLILSWEVAHEKRTKTRCA